MAERHAQSLAGVCQELFCSPESEAGRRIEHRRGRLCLPSFSLPSPITPLSSAVIRQGEMQYLDGPTARWAQAHFVLTRAGFLHWFRSSEQVEKPIGALSLARCGV